MPSARIASLSVRVCALADRIRQSPVRYTPNTTETRMLAKLVCELAGKVERLEARLKAIEKAGRE